MRLNKRLIFAVLVTGVALALLAPVLLGRCVSEIVRDKPELTDIEQEMCLTASSGNDLEYWIAGERTTDGCHWHLEHVKCQWRGCLYRCKENEILWRLSKDGNAIIMKKDVKGTNSNLPKQYRFAVVGQ